MSNHISSHIFRVIAVALITLSLLACGVNEASIGVDDELSATALELSANTKPTGNPRNTTRYFIRHDQNWDVTQTADRPEGTHPFGGYTPGFFAPGGSMGLIAEAGKPLFIVYDHYEQIIEHPPAICHDEFTGTSQRCSYEDSGYFEYISYAHRRLHYRIDGGPVSTLELPQGMPGGQIDIPPGAGGELEYWVELEGTDGSTTWDSRFGKNYRVKLLRVPTATITFDDQWATGVSGTVQSGQTVQIDYDVDRLAGQLMGLPNPGSAASGSVRAYVSFDGKSPVDVPVDMGLTVAFAPVVEVPLGARHMSLWFKGTIPVYPAGEQWHWHDVYDSKHGSNYGFAVQP